MAIVSQQHYLAQLQPAATKLLLDPDSGFTEWVRLTMLDLIYKQVFVVKREYWAPSSREADREYTMIRRGPQYRKYPGMPYEKPFFEIWKERDYFQPREIVKKVYMQVDWHYRYSKEIIHDHNISNLFSGNPLWRMFRKLKLNTKGVAVRQELSTTLTTIDNHLEQWVAESPQKVLDLFQTIQGNLFLLENLSPELLQQLQINSSNQGLNGLEHLMTLSESLDNIGDSFYGYAYEGPDEYFYDTYLDFD